MAANPPECSTLYNLIVGVTLLGISFAACSSDPNEGSPALEGSGAAAKAGAAGVYDTQPMNAVAGGVGGRGGTTALAGSAGLAERAPLDSRYDFIQLAAGQRHICARLIDGRIKCWGQNGGWLGLGDYENRGDNPGEMGSALSAVALGGDWVADSVAARDLAVCVVLHSGGIKCWGVNSMGELGLGDTLPRGGDANTMGENLPTVDLGPRGRVAEVAVGANHACARTDDGLVLCWGANNLGQLGRGDNQIRGDEPGEMGNQLEPVALGTGRTAIQLAAGWSHTCALLDDHGIKCWGANAGGELGLGDVEPRGDEPDEMGDALPRVNLGNGQLARGIYAGEQYNCAILEDRRVKCWGTNEFMQLGNGTTNPRGDSPLHMGDSLPYTDLGVDFAAKALALGGHHACAISTLGNVKCWGLNWTGQLGIGSTVDHGSPLDTMGAGLPRVDFGQSRRALAIAVGLDFSCATLDDGNVVCWGDNRYGQLGIGSVESIGTQSSQIGASFASTLLD